MSAQSELPRARVLTGTLLGLVVAFGSFAVSLSAAASLNADTSIPAPTVRLSAASEPESGTASKSSEEAPREDGVKLRSSDTRPSADTKGSTDAKAKDSKDSKVSKDSKDSKDARDATDSDGSKAGPRADARSGAGLYQIRCWQEGRLVFEETARSIDLAPGRYSTKFQGKDRNGSPLYVADTRNSTCLIKGVEGTSERVPTWLR